MQFNEAIEKMTATAEAAAEKIRNFGLSAVVEKSYMNPLLQTVDNPKKAKYITVSVVISTPETKEGDEYCLSVGAEMRGGKIDDDLLSKDLDTLNSMIDETIERLSTFENRAEGVAILANEAEEEYQKLVGKLSEEQKKQRVISAIGVALVFVGIIILFMVATFYS